MSEYKLNRQKLVIAAIVVLLCLISVTGATFALFTSRAEDGTIGINSTSGRLEVDIVDTSKDENSLLGDALNFVTSNETQEILFEPGAVYRTEGFRIKNRGNIPFNFIVYISEDNRLSADFYDAFEVWLTKDPVSRTDMVKLQDFDGRLEAEKTSDVYYLVFRMKEDAGNEFQNREFYGVGITVCAVQGNVKFP